MVNEMNRALLFLCTSLVAAALLAGTEPVLRLGVASDVHLKTCYDTKKADAVLAACAKREVDGMMVLGDITDYGLVPELRLFGAAWDRAFPGGRTPSGKTCEKLFIYGDHDMCGTIHKRMPDAHVKPYGTRADVERLVIRNYGAAKAWKEVFHEDWRRIRTKTVKGYDFILASYSEGEADNKLGNRTSGLDKYLATFKTDPAKPFFFLQHRMFRETMLWQDDALTVLDVPVVSMGFNGNGKCEPGMAEVLARTDASAIVLQAFANMHEGEEKDCAKLEAFVREVRAKAPETPVVLLEYMYPLESRSYKHAFVPKLYEKLKAEDADAWAKLDIVRAKDTFAADSDMTSDGGHLNDYGQRQLAFAVSRVLGPRLGVPVPDGPWGRK